MHSKFRKDQKGVNKSSKVSSSSNNTTDPITNIKCYPTSFQLHQSRVDCPDMVEKSTGDSKVSDNQTGSCYAPEDRKDAASTTILLS